MSAPTPPQPRVEVRVADSPAAYGDVDAMYVHAHPDDESLDFGALMSRLSAEGRSGVMVCFTDGESGLDQYPWRRTGGLYPPRDLQASELAEVRRIEMANALSVLGVRTYVQLGLRNHPYASGADVLENGALMDAWGGEELLIRQMTELIETFRPEVVVSPDSGHGGAHEHFEHAGVGYVVRMALARVNARGRHQVLAHLRSVDPRYVATYGSLDRIDAMERDPRTDRRYREVQVLALREHVTQRDATAIGVESVTSHRWEYYVSEIRDDSSDLSDLDSFLRTW